MLLPNKITFLLISSVLIGLFSNSANAQEYSIANRQIRFAMTGILYNNVKFNHLGDEYFKSRPMPSGQLNVQYFRKIKPNYGISVFSDIDILPQSFRFPYNPIIDENTMQFEMVPDISFPFNEYQYYRYGFGIGNEYFFSTHKKINYSIELGGKINFICYLFPEIGGTFTYDDILVFDYESDKVRTAPFLSIFSKFGFLKLKDSDRNSYNLKLVGNLAFTDWLFGSYEFFNLKEGSSKGTFTQKASYLGIEMSVSFGK